MGMMFGGWLREEEEKSEEDKIRDEWFRRGRWNGWNSAIARAQVLVLQSGGIEYDRKQEMWDELEGLKFREDQINEL